MNAKTGSMVLAALFAALTAAGAFFRIPLGAMSVTLQVFFTCLAGVLLGPRWGAASQAVYVALGLIGLPVFIQGGGLSYLLVPSCGFLFGLIPAAWVTGALTQGEASRPRVAAACLAGHVVLYLIGLPYMYAVLRFYLGRTMGLGALLQAGCLVYLPGDCLKIAAAAWMSGPLFNALGLCRENARPRCAGRKDGGKRA